MSFPKPSFKALWLSVAALSLLYVACGPSTQFYKEVDGYTSNGEYEKAVAQVKYNERSYGDKSTVLYQLDLGALYHYAGDPDSSNKYLFEAEKEIEDLYTKSISLTALSFLLNDNVIPYEGEDFEKVLVNVFLALNYASKGMDEDALVEARKVDLKLREYARQYDGKNKYQDDAFIRYIAGVLYENEGEINDAFISYKKSYETYGTYEREYHTSAPAFLLDDLVRTGSYLSFDDEVEAYKELGGREPDGAGERSGGIIVIAYVGKSPVKIEERPTVSVPDSSGTLHTFQIALPKFVPRYRSGRSYSVTVVGVGDTMRAGALLAENITAIAGKSLEDRLGLTYLKSGGRALAKFLASEKAKKDIKEGGDSRLKNFLASLALDVAVGISEQADTRSWRTLPAEIHLARLNLLPGEYTVSIASSDGGYSLKDELVNVKPGRTSFVIVDDLR
jgi:hypothetical protein